MKIILNSKDHNFVNVFSGISKKTSLKDYENNLIEIQASRIESGIFDVIADPSVDAYLINVPVSYSQKAVDFIKRKTPYVPIIVFGDLPSISKVSGADIYMPFYEITEDAGIEIFFDLVVFNLNNYLRNFFTLKKLTTKMEAVLEFGNCQYDPTRRTFSFKGKGQSKYTEVKKLSSKEGGIIEILASNFGEVVKKEIILEKVWHKSDYFSGRSMDVYITHLRSLFKEKGVDVTIKNISGVGLILE